MHYLVSWHFLATIVYALLAAKARNDDKNDILNESNKQVECQVSKCHQRPARVNNDNVLDRWRLLTSG